MWMDAYVQETLLRQRMAEVDRHAAMSRQLRVAESPRPPRRVGALITRFRNLRTSGFPRRAASYR